MSAREQLEKARSGGVYAEIVAAERALLAEFSGGAEKKKLSAEEVRSLREQHPEWFGMGGQDEKPVS